MPAAVLRRARALGAMVALLALTAGCGRSGPPPIAYDGSVSCEYCRMTVTDPRYGAELITEKGKVLAFDSIECLASYYAQAAGRGAAPRAWVSDFQHPGTLIPADSARYLRGGPSSPMALNVLAVSPAASTDDLRRQLGGGDVMTWSAVLELVAAEAARTAR